MAAREPLQGADRLRRKMAELDREVERVTRIEVKRGLLNIETGAKRRCAVGVAGFLRNKITHETAPDGLSGRAGTNVDYAPSVEHGARPHWPPHDALDLWVRRKLGISDPREVKRAAFLIRRAISRRGTKAQPFLFPAFEEERPKFQTRLRAAIKAAAAKVASSR